MKLNSGALSVGSSTQSTLYGWRSLRPGYHDCCHFHAVRCQDLVVTASFQYLPSGPGIEPSRQQALNYRLVGWNLVSSTHLSMPHSRQMTILLKDMLRLVVSFINEC